MSLSRKIIVSAKLTQFSVLLSVVGLVFKIHSVGKESNLNINIVSCVYIFNTTKRGTTPHVIKITIFSNVWQTSSMFGLNKSYSNILY
jgi:hypothetical protein